MSWRVDNSGINIIRSGDREVEERRLPALPAQPPTLRHVCVYVYV